jgi:hypothetical protein
MFSPLVRKCVKNDSNKAKSNLNENLNELLNTQSPARASIEASLVSNRVKFFENWSQKGSTTIIQPSRIPAKRAATNPEKSLENHADQENQTPSILNTRKSENHPRADTKERVESEISLPAMIIIKPRANLLPEVELALSPFFEERAIEVKTEEKETRQKRNQDLYTERKTSRVQCSSTTSSPRDRSFESESSPQMDPVSIFRQAQQEFQFPSHLPVLCDESHNELHNDSQNEPHSSDHISDDENEPCEEEDQESELSGELSESTTSEKSSETSVVYQDGDFIGIVDYLMEHLTEDDQRAWKTFSSYSLVQESHQSFSSLDREQFLNIIENQRSELEWNKTQLSAYRANLYEALHLLAKNEYNLRLCEQKLLDHTSQYLELEQSFHHQRQCLLEIEQKQLHQEIEFYRLETRRCKQQVDQLRHQIRSSLSGLTPQQQQQVSQELMIEDPFIECSVQLLESKTIPIRTISQIEQRFSKVIDLPAPVKQKKSKSAFFFFPHSIR